MAVSAGATTEIDASAAADSMDSGRIDNAAMLVAYNTSNTDLAARVVDINTGAKTLTPNAENNIETYSTNIQAIRVSRFSATKFMSVATGSGPGLTKAQVLNVSGTTVTGATSLTLTDDANTGIAVFTLTTTTVLFVYSYGTGSSIDTVARVLSIDGSDNITEGARLVLHTDPSAANTYSCNIYSATKAAYVFNDQDDNEFFKAKLLTISGSTVTAGAVQNLNTTDSGDANAVCAIEVSSTQIVAGYSDTGGSNYIFHVVTLSDPTLTAGASLTLGSAEHGFPKSGIAANSQNILATGQVDATTSRVTQLGLSGTTLSHTASDFVNITTGSSLAIDSIVKITNSFGFVTTEATVEGTVVESDAATVATPGELTLAPMPKPSDIDADSTFLYIGAIDSLTFPTVIKFATALNADGSVVFNPGAGDDIGVQCGRENAQVIWIAGKFDGTNVVEKSEDAGSSFTVKDDGSFGDVEAFVVGPDSDNRVLIADDNVNIEETIDSGAVWINRNTTTGFNVNAIARLGINPQETIFGNDANATDNIDSSVNSGVNMEDFTTGDFPTDADVTSVIVN